MVSLRSNSPITRIQRGKAKAMSQSTAVGEQFSEIMVNHTNNKGREFAPASGSHVCLLSARQRNRGNIRCHRFSEQKGSFESAGIQRLVQLFKNLHEMLPAWNTCTNSCGLELPIGERDDVES